MAHEEYGLVGNEIQRSEDSLARLGLLGNRSYEYLELVGATEANREARPLGADPDGDPRVASLTELESLASLEECVPTPDWAPPLSAHAYATLLGTVAVYHAALPFAEPERGWLYTNLRETQADGSMSVIEEYDTLAMRKTTLIVQGLRQVTSGEQLINRWHDWRTNHGQYEGHNTFHVACSALRQIVELIPPG